MKNRQQVHRGKPVPLARAMHVLTGLADGDVRLLIAMGGAYVGKLRCKDPNYQVRDGQIIAAWWNYPLQMETIPFQKSWMVHQDRKLLIAAKPVGLPTQGRRDADYMAFYELLKNHTKGYLALHHRLDQDTSGLMLFCRDKQLNRDVAAIFTERLVEKRYLAFCEGTWPEGKDEIVISEPIGARREKTGTKQVIDAKGKPAETRVHLIARDGNKFLVSCQPKTGRTHQIRVHLAHIGAPLWGDGLYGTHQEVPFLLHCYALKWPNRGALKSGNWKLQVPEAWQTHLPPSLWDAYQQWWEETC